MLLPALVRELITASFSALNVSAADGRLLRPLLCLCWVDGLLLLGFVWDCDWLSIIAIITMRWWCLCFYSATVKELRLGLLDGQIWLPLPSWLPVVRTSGKCYWCQLDGDDRIVPFVGLRWLCRDREKVHSRIKFPNGNDVVMADHGWFSWWCSYCLSFHNSADMPLRRGMPISLQSEKKTKKYIYCKWFHI